MLIRLHHHHHHHHHHVQCREGDPRCCAAAELCGGVRPSGKGDDDDEDDDDDEVHDHRHRHHCHHYHRCGLLRGSLLRHWNVIR